MTFDMMAVSTRPATMPAAEDMGPAMTIEADMVVAPEGRGVVEAPMVEAPEMMVPDVKAPSEVMPVVDAPDVVLMVTMLVMVPAARFDRGAA